MKDYVIFVDASCDIDTDFAEKNNIVFLPMTYFLDEESFIASGKDSNEQLNAFYAEIKKGRKPSTSQVTPYTYEEACIPYLQKGISVLCLCLSSGLSSTFASAQIASQNLKANYSEAILLPIDSLGATVGMGIIVEQMVKNKNNGLNIHQNYETTKNYVSKIHLSAWVDDIMHLKRGGRIGGATATFASILNIKPMIMVTPEGKLENYDKKRGSKRACQAMVDHYANTGLIDDSTSVYIADADNEEMSLYLENKLKEVNPKIVVKRNKLCVIIGAHVGPGAMVISFERK